MKLKNTCLKLGRALAVAGAISIPAAFAGPPPPPPVIEDVPPPPPPVETTGYLWDSVNATLSAGYNSDYIWRGLDLGRNQIWTDLNIDLAISDCCTINVGAWYSDLNSNRGASDSLTPQELDLYAGFTTSLDWIDLNFGLIYYYFDSHSDEFLEVYGGFGFSLWVIDFAGTYFYETQDQSHYGEFSAETSIELTDWMSLVPGALVSVSDKNTRGFFVPEHDAANKDSGFQHIAASLALNINLTPTAKVVPYCAYSYQLDAIEASDQNGFFYGGVKVSVTF